MTRREVRTYVALAFAGALLLSYLLTTANQVATVEDQRVACEASNRARASELYQRASLKANALARRQTPATHAEGAEALPRARQAYRRLIHSVPDKVAPGSVRRDCHAAFRKPFPFNLID